MTKTIQNGRYKIRRSQNQDSLIIPAESANSIAILEPEDPSRDEIGTWILTIDPSIASEGAVSATLQHEGTKAYLALDNPTSPHQHTGIFVSSGDKQVWMIKSGSTTEYERENEYYIRYPNLVDGQALVVDISMLRVYPPRLALLPFEEGYTSPWVFEPIA